MLGDNYKVTSLTVKKYLNIKVKDLNDVAYYNNFNECYKYCNDDDPKRLITLVIDLSLLTIVEGAGQGLFIPSFKNFEELERELSSIERINYKKIVKHKGLINSLSSL